MAVTTTLPLFWHLSSSVKEERLDSSVKLVSVLEGFQEHFRNDHAPSKPVNGIASNAEDDDENGNPMSDALSKELDIDNAADVAYAIRRLMRGLASPRESSRLGFAVALTELMKRIDTISCEQMLALLKATSQASGTMSKQEERDVLFARLFGIKSIVQSGLVVSQKLLNSSSGVASSLKSFENVITELVALGEEKSWLRESCWWTLGSAIDVLHTSTVPWKKQAFHKIVSAAFSKDGPWTAEKVAIAIKLQKLHAVTDWKPICGSSFKEPDLLARSNLTILGRILKESVADEEDVKVGSTPWKPQLHFVWDTVLDVLLSGDDMQSRNFADFYRIVVDESLFASSSSPERKYWGFQVFQECLRRLPSVEIPMLFTKNFMRTWINHLSKNDRYLHKISRQAALDIKDVVEKNPQIGFSVVLQLTGVNGSSNFDKITKTKTVENIIASTSKEGIENYVHHLLGQVNLDSSDDSYSSLDARRGWIIDQLAALLQRHDVPRSNTSVESVLDWLTTQAFFETKKTPKKDGNAALFPKPPFTEKLKALCAKKLYSCLSDLISKQAETKDAHEESKGNTSEAQEKLSHVLDTISRLEKDTKHFTACRAPDEDQQKKFSEALAAADKAESSKHSSEGSVGLVILLRGLALLCYGEGNEEDWETLQDCTETTKKLINASKDKTKKRRKAAEETVDEDRPPVDFIVDIVIGLLERSVAFSKALAHQCFEHLTPLLGSSSIDLILAQLDRRNPNEEDEEEGVDFEEKDSPSESPEGSDDEEAILDEDEEAALRKALDAVISQDKDNNEDDTESASSESSMDDEQMMAIDEQLTEVFKTEAERRGKGKNTDAQREATHFKNRVLDLVDIYMKKQPTNPLVLRFIMPLVELILTSSSDEKQLSDKTKGVLKSRLQKAKDVPSLPDASFAAEILTALHERARKASTAETVNLISICSLFVSKSLLAVDKKAVIDAYGQSAKDFITRKASALTPAFFFDFIRRHPSAGLDLQPAIIETLDAAANGYRLSQVFSILQAIYTSLQQPDPEKNLKSMQAVAKAIESVISESCTDGKLSASQMKDTLKTAQQLSRLGKRIAQGKTSIDMVWSPSKWEKLANELSVSKHYSSSTSLPNICNAIAKLAQSSEGGSGKKAAESGKATKRKVEGDEETTKVQRKKVKKDKSKDT